MDKKRKTRFQAKLDYLFWFLIMLLPIFIYLFQCWGNTPTIGFFDFLSDFSPFPFITDILNNVTQTAFNSTFALNGYIGYCVAVEIIHVLFDVIVFIPRFAHKLIAKAVQDD